MLTLELTDRASHNSGCALDRDVDAVSARCWMVFVRALAFALTLISLKGATVEAQAPTEEQRNFFETKIRPVFVEHCYRCHSSESKPLHAGLRLDSRDAWKVGGDSGPAIDPDKPSESLLLKALRYDGLEMPPEGKLPSNVVSDFEAWIAMGAPDPRDEQGHANSVASSAIETGKQHWAFQQLRMLPNFGLSNPSAASGTKFDSEIDRILDDLYREKGLEPAPIADRHTLIRRLFFDLVGLPPSPEQIAEFVDDRRPDAYSRLVDRLLASPEYGERWGRYWLDLARYADSNGADENHEYPNAWRYRDYVVSAFNRDLPYDQFVIQQLAGDLLASSNEVERREQLTATGYLILGPRMLAEQDKKKLVADLVDEQLDTIGKTFLGLTFGCARCHDHKFDPISQKDYYALAGVLHSTKSMANFEFVSKWNERDLPDEQVRIQIESHQQKVDQLKQELAAFEKSTEAAMPALLEAKKKEIEEFEKTRPAYATAMAADEATVSVVPVSVRGNHLRPTGEPITRAIPTVFGDSTGNVEFPASASGRLELAKWLVDPRNPLTARVMVNRIWKGHFGEGIVRSVSNFGIRGDAPISQDLLDYLASEFIRQQWSIKSMHRVILHSQAYQRQAKSIAKNELIDPDNRLFWRQNRRRLEIEPLRDALIVLGQNLDRKIGGRAESVYGSNYTDEGGRGKDVQDALRRAIYLPINRAAIAETFATFDYVDSSVSVGQRPSTTVPHQALFMMNHPLVMQQAKLISRVSRAKYSEDEQRQNWILLAITGRPMQPADAELRRGFFKQLEAILKTSQVPAEQHEELCWTRYCHAVLLSNEFIYVD